jgi:trans-aconitate methyltransferase
VANAIVDTWAGGDAYERYVGRWSRLAAETFVEWVALPSASGWLDVGCGTGALSATILHRAAPARVHGVDPSLAFVKQARRTLTDACAQFAVGRAEQLPIASQRFDAVVSALALNFVPTPETALAEMVRAARPNGLVAVYVWDYAEGMQLMRRFWDAAVALDSAAASIDEGRRFPICNPERLYALFRDAGLDAIETRAIDVPTWFRDFDDYWMPFLGAQGPAPGYVMALTDEHRARLRDRLRRTLPAAADGSIALTARAWTIRGRKGRA